MNTQKLKDNLSKLEAKADGLLIRLAGSSYTVGILVALLLLALIVWAWW